MKADFDTIRELPPIFGEVRQLAYIVPDIDAAMQQWADEAGIDSFIVARNQAPMKGAWYRGEPGETARVNIAFGYIGDMQLELIELIGDTPSLYKEAIDREITGLHHYAVCVENFAEVYRWGLANGYESVVDTGVDGLVRMSYIENRQENLILEVIEWNPLTRPYFDSIEKLVKESDKSQLVREFQLSDITPKAAALVQLIKFMFKKLLGQVEKTHPASLARG